eukprot:3982843-Karenia_brevis.AAC.1
MQLAQKELCAKKEEYRALQQQVRERSAKAQADLCRELADGPSMQAGTEQDAEVLDALENVSLDDGKTPRAGELVSLQVCGIRRPPAYLWYAEALAAWVQSHILSTYVLGDKKDLALETLKFRAPKATGSFPNPNSIRLMSDFATESALNLKMHLVGRVVLAQDAADVDRKLIKSGFYCGGPVPVGGEFDAFNKKLHMYVVPIVDYPSGARGNATPAWHIKVLSGRQKKDDSGHSEGEVMPSMICEFEKITLPALGIFPEMSFNVAVAKVNPEFVKKTPEWQPSINDYHELTRNRFEVEKEIDEIKEQKKRGKADKEDPENNIGDVSAFVSGILKEDEPEGFEAYCKQPFVLDVPGPGCTAIAPTCTKESLSQAPDDAPPPVLYGGMAGRHLDDDDDDDDDDEDDDD